MADTIAGDRVMDVEGFYMRKALLACAGLMALASPAASQEGGIVVRAAYLTQKVEIPPVLSNLDDPIPDEGLQGARLGIADNNSTGRFLKQKFVLDETTLDLNGDIAKAVADIAAKGHRFVIADLHDEALDKALAAPGAESLVFLNAGSVSDRFRNQDCRANLLHTSPSRAMLADALGQFLVKKKWGEWFLVTGPRPEDALFADAVKRSAKRFGAKIVAEKAWSGEFDLRRSAQSEVGLFTQGPDYDVLIVADEIGDFGEYLPYQTWDPRPVAGTQGLVPRGWHKTVEQWGAAQLQRRFKRQAERPMTARDYAAWTAARLVGEAATRARSADGNALEAALRAKDFELAAFKGRPLSFRQWDGQLRQPIPVTADRALVALSPQEGFLHPVNEMDTLGHDKAETACKLGTQ